MSSDASTVEPSNVTPIRPDITAPDERAEAIERIRSDAQSAKEKFDAAIAARQ